LSGLIYLAFPLFSGNRSHKSSLQHLLAPPRTATTTPTIITATMTVETNPNDFKEYNPQKKSRKKRAMIGVAIVVVVVIVAVVIALAVSHTR
jgi:hypothetical protein